MVDGEEGEIVGRDYHDQLDNARDVRGLGALIGHDVEEFPQILNIQICTFWLIDVKIFNMRVIPYNLVNNQ